MHISRRSLLFPEKLGIKYKEELQMDQIAEDIDYLKELDLEQTNVDESVDIIILQIPLKLQLEKMLTTYHNRGGICNAQTWRYLQ